MCSPYHSWLILAFQIIENFGNIGSPEADSPYADPEDSELVADAKKEVLEPTDYEYAERDVILYNLGIGAEATELQWVYENHDAFAALPTFGVIPQFAASSGMPLDWLPNYNPVCKFPSRAMPLTDFDAITGKTSARGAISLNQGTHTDQREVD